MEDDYVVILNVLQKRVDNTVAALEELGEKLGVRILVDHTSDDLDKVPLIQDTDFKKLSEDDSAIYKALQNLSPPLADSYMQVKNDMSNPNRISWTGTAHEIREILSNVLRILAPNDLVKAQQDYKQEKDTSGPTQKQRVIYILRQHNADTKTMEIVNKVVHLEDMIGDVIRGIYNRASDAAHGHKDKKEVRRILRYFESFIPDILNLD